MVFAGKQNSLTSSKTKDWHDPAKASVVHIPGYCPENSFEAVQEISHVLHPENTHLKVYSGHIRNVR